MSKIKDFYDQIQFPGHYTYAQLQYHYPDIRNPYLKIINSAVSQGSSILDVGCGTGLVSNLFAVRYPDKQFTSLDFADSIDYAKEFAKNNKISNVQFVKEDFLQCSINKTYDVVICQGVLHHIPNAADAAGNLSALVAANGLLVLGVYHPAGKIAKRFVNINYCNETLRADQEDHPYETAYTQKQVEQLFPTFKIVAGYPSSISIVNAISAMFNYRNGGLVTYILRKNHD